MCIARLALTAAATLASVVTLVACGDNAPAVADGGVIDAAPADAAVGPPTIAITSPVAGATVVGNRIITVTGTIAGGAAIRSVVGQVGGVNTGLGTFDQTAFAFDVELGDNANTITATVTDELGRAATATVSVSYPFVALTSFADAALVLGQPDAVTATRGTTAAQFGLVVGRPSWGAGTLWLGDLGNRRGVAYRGFPSRTGEPADFALGQADLTSATTGVSATKTFGLTTIQAAGGHLYAADRQVGRILVYATPPTMSSAAADYAIGEVDLATAGSDCGAGQLDQAADFQVVGDKIIVADANNNRVLIWNSIPNASGVLPDLVLGQADLTHCAANDDNQDGSADATPTARTFGAPQSVWSDGTRLLIADPTNGRVLVWKTFPTTSFAAADTVLGQTTFTAVIDESKQPAATARSLFAPSGIDSNGNQLAISDSGLNRVLIWNAFPADATVAADVVLGQGDFTHDGINDDAQTGMPSISPTARTLALPIGVRFVRGTLIVADSANSRYLVFGALPCPSGQYETPADSGTCVDDPCVGACVGQLCANATGAAVCY